MGQQRPTPEQIQAFRAQVQTPDLRNDLLNLARGVDPTFGFLSGMLPEPEREDPALQIAAGLIPIGVPARALAGLRNLLASGKVVDKVSGLMSWADSPWLQAQFDADKLKLAELGMDPANAEDARDLLRMMSEIKAERQVVSGQDLADAIVRLEAGTPQAGDLLRRTASEIGQAADKMREGTNRLRSRPGQSSFLAASETPDWVSMLRRSSDEGAFSRGQVEQMMRGSSPVEFSPALTRILQGAAVLGGAVTDNPWVGLAARQTGGMLAGTVNELRKVKRDREEQR